MCEIMPELMKIIMKEEFQENYAKAYKEAYDEAYAEGYKEGVRIGEEYVNSCLSQLYDILIPQKRQDDFIRSAIDLEYRDKLCKEYGIKLLEELRIM